jgi:cytochrome P450
MTGENKAAKETHPTIFAELLESDLPPVEKSVARLGDEAQLMLGAGIETVGWTLAVTTFHVINNGAIFAKLRAELKEALPTTTTPLSCQKLERLPYLTACIQEGLRLAYAVTSRNPRISPDKVTKYKNWTIPAGIPVSMTVVDVNHDEDVFPDSHSYMPERWLKNPKTKNGQSLGRYSVPFGKGARSCLGIK